MIQDLTWHNNHKKKWRILFYYRPQTKFVKVMFSQVSLYPQGGSLCPAVAHYPGGLCPEGVTVRAGSLSSEGLCPARVFVQGVSVQSVSVQQGVSITKTPRYGNVRAVRILLECILVRHCVKD